MIRALTDDQLIDSLRALVAKSNRTEAEILRLIQEVEARRLYLDRAHATLFSFCTSELGYSEDAAYNRIEVARAGVRFPAMLDALAEGRVHLTGLRLIAPHLTHENHAEVLARAAKKSKREIAELIASLAPKPAVEDSIRKLPVAHPAAAAPVSAPSPVPAIPAPPALVTPPPSQLPPERRPVVAPPPSPLPPERRPVVAPLAEDAFRVQFTVSRAVKDKLREAQDLLAHQLPGGDLAKVVEKALDLLIAREKKRQFGAGVRPKKPVTSRSPRPASPPPASPPPASPRPASPRPASRHVPAAVRREVFERDGHRCTFVDERGHRCEATGGLELDHLDGFARVGVHDAQRISVRCGPHNQHAADKMYGRAFMQRARSRSELSSRDETS